MHELDMIALKVHIKSAIKEAFAEMEYEKVKPIPNKPMLNPAQIYEQQMLAQKQEMEKANEASRRKKKP